MRQLFTFLCSECQAVTDRYIEYTKEIDCPDCGSRADKIISIPTVRLEGYSGDFPGAAMKWRKKHLQDFKREES